MASIKRIFLAGATGFIGKEILRCLVRGNYIVRCPVRSGSESRLVEFGNQVEIVTADLCGNKSPYHYMSDCDAVINAVGIIREFPRRKITFERIHFELNRSLVDSALKRGIHRFLLVSANGAQEDAPTRYQTSKAKSEKYLINSGFNYTIFRPSVVFGNPEKRIEFFTQLWNSLYINWIRPPFLPNIDGGHFQFSPVYVCDLAQGIVNSLEQKDCYEKVFPVAGPDIFEWNDLLDLLNQVRGKRKCKVFTPSFLLRGPSRLMQKFGFGPLTYDQLIMMLEGNTCDGSEFFRTTNITPTRLSAKTLEYLVDRDNNIV